MQLNRIIALLLIVICFIAAALGIQHQQVQDTFDLKAFDKSGDRLELVTLDGIISGGRTSIGAMAVRNRLQELKEIDRVRGVLLAINSPGGTVGASKEVYEAVKQLRQIKPIVVSMLDQATSGGYYIASAATKIYANSGTLTGSIGVILSSFNVRELFNRVGVESQTIKTGPYKDIFSPYRPISEPERQLLQDLLQGTYRDFIADVAEGRKMDLEAVRKLADGRIYTGRQAKENGLVDEVGTYEAAVEDLRKQARERFKLPASKELPIERSPGSLERLFDQLFSRSPIPLPVGLPSPITTAVETLAQKILKTPSTGLSADDPPLLLMPSWYQ